MCALDICRIYLHLRLPAIKAKPPTPSQPIASMGTWELVLYECSCNMHALVLCRNVRELCGPQSSLLLPRSAKVSHPIKSNNHLGVTLLRGSRSGGPSRPKSGQDFISKVSLFTCTIFGSFSSSVWWHWHKDERRRRRRHFQKFLLLWWWLAVPPRCRGPPRDVRDYKFRGIPQLPYFYNSISKQEAHFWNIFFSKYLIINVL